jgi:hypothetical protein
MPSPEIAYLFQRCLIWPVQPGAAWDGYGRPSKIAQFTVTTAPIEIPCRWIDGDYEAMDAQGNTITLNAKVVVVAPIIIKGQTVISDFVAQSRMWLGTLAAYNSLSAPPDSRVMEIKKIDKAPSLKARFYRRELGLMRYTNKPTG